jgi:CyaY protein
MMPNLSMMFEIHLKAAVVEDCDLLKNLREFSMSESEFLALAEAVLDAIETGMERAGEAADVDLECSRSGNVLEIEFIDQGSKIIVNTQAAMQEIWVAARAGGFHYRMADDQSWKDTRDGSELFGALSRLASAQAGAILHLKTGDGDPS